MFLATAVIASAIVVFLLMRFGLLALIGANLFDLLVNTYPISMDPSKHQFALGLIGPLIILALAICAFNVSLGGRRLFVDTKSA
jgi:hypothetical protein